MTTTDAGQAPDGERATVAELAAGDLTAKVMTYGATLMDFRVDGRPIVLGSPDVAPYGGPLKNAGAVVGRVANRIAGASFPWKDGTCEVVANDGRNCLHGGPEGTAKVSWRMASADERSCRLTLTLPDGHMGFPGEMSVTATYTLDEDGLTLVVEAVAAEDTVSNFAHHPFFDLTGKGEGWRQTVRVAADRYLPVDDETLPTGEIAEVADPYDLREARTLDPDAIYDNNWCLGDSRGQMRDVAAIEADGIRLTISTTEPGLQLFSGHKFVVERFEGVATHTGEAYRPRAGYAVEAQHWPDAPNRPEFPQIMRHAGETDRMEVRYTVSRV